MRSLFADDDFPGYLFEISAVKSNNLHAMCVNVGLLYELESTQCNIRVVRFHH